jgi:hypothetical protein
VGVRFDRPPPRPGCDSSFLVVFQRIAASPSRFEPKHRHLPDAGDGLLGGRGMQKPGRDFLHPRGVPLSAGRSGRSPRLSWSFSTWSLARLGEFLVTEGERPGATPGNSPSPPQTSRPGTGRSRSASPKPAAWPAWRPRRRPPGDRAAGAAEPENLDGGEREQPVPHDGRTAKVRRSRAVDQDGQGSQRRSRTLRATAQAGMDHRPLNTLAIR